MHDFARIWLIEKKRALPKRIQEKKLRVIFSPSIKENEKQVLFCSCWYFFKSFNIMLFGHLRTQLKVVQKKKAHWLISTHYHADERSVKSYSPQNSAGISQESVISQIVEANTDPYIIRKCFAYLVQQKNIRSSLSPVKLQDYFVNDKTSPDFPSAWVQVHNCWIFISGWTIPFSQSRT